MNLEYKKITASHMEHIREIRASIWLPEMDSDTEEYYREWYANVKNWYDDVKKVNGVNWHLKRNFRFLAECASYPKSGAGGTGVKHDSICLVSKEVFKKRYFGNVGNAREHPIPVCVLMRLITPYLDIKENKGTEIANWNSFFCEFFRYSVLLVLITKEENQKLNDLGLKQKLPEKSKSNFLSFPRYKQAGIEVFVKSTGKPFRVNRTH